MYYNKVSPEFVMIGMEYCTGGSLEQHVRLRIGETISESIIKSSAYQILSAMLNYSEKGYVHRDIKPENILIDSHGEIKLSDFGLAKETKGQSKLSLSIGLAGTERYISPELKNGEKQSIKSDVWSFGVVILELAYGRNAFKVDQIQSLKPKKIISMFKKRRGYSTAMAQFLSRCFEREITDRATVDELLRDEWLKDVELYAVVPTIKSGNNN